MSAVTTCRTCGTRPLENARFCHSCGSPIAAAPAELKQVTVLFADVVQSMDLAAAVGAERLREIMAGLFERCATVVRRYGGTVDKFTGDGIMAVFGAPVALEDHALRACLAALEIQRHSAEVELRLRVGLNSGEVVAGEIGSGAYTAIGAQVGMAQRMESVAPPGGVMLSESTVRLVDGRVVLAEPELVVIKGAADPVRACRLLAVSGQAAEGAQCGLVGRRWEMTAATALLDRAIDGSGAVVGVVAPPGIGKSRLVREIAAMATERGVAVFTAFCESHATEIPFHVVERLLRAATGVADLDRSAARARVRAQLPDADEQDLVLFDDLVGIADPGTEIPRIDPDARRRRLTALVNASTLARTSPEVYVIEDAQWIDEVSESMLADFMAVVPQSRSLMVITYRPEYQGALSRVTGAQTIALAPLSDSESSALIAALLGPDASTGELADVIAERAAGNPFFAQEIVRDLAERGALTGERGGYRLLEATDRVAVPATLQATIAARIDRLDPAAKRTLHAVAVIGSRFGDELLGALDVDPVFEDLVRAEFIDQVRFTPHAEYVFHHPLIRAVAYESQLKSDRAVLHRRLAEAIEVRDPAAADANAALIAEHLEAAGDVRAAYDWQMRAGVRAAKRNICAAQLSWERAAGIADALGDDDPNRTAMRIAPRAMLCGTAWRVLANVADRFAELQVLCSSIGDKGSLALAMSGLIGEHMHHGRMRTASQVASELMALVESIGDPALAIGLAVTQVGVKHETGEVHDILRAAQVAIALAEGDPTRGDVFFECPLALNLAARGLARWALGRTGWRDDIDAAITMARSADAMTYVMCVMWGYGSAVGCGVLLPNNAIQQEIDEAVRVAERSADEVTVGLALLTLVVALLNQDAPDYPRALTLLHRLRDMCVRGTLFASERSAIALWIAYVNARQGDRDLAVPPARDALNDMFDGGQFGYAVLGTPTLVEMLLERGGSDDLAEAQAAIDRLAAAPLSDDYVLRDLTLLRLRALLAGANGDEDGYRDFASRYRTLANDLGFEGHLALAEAMS